MIGKSTETSCSRIIRVEIQVDADAPRRTGHQGEASRLHRVVNGGFTVSSGTGNHDVHVKTDPTRPIFAPS